MNSTKSSKAGVSFNSFVVAEQLVGGAPLSIVPSNEYQSVMTALCALRQEAISVNQPKPKIDMIKRMIYELESMISLPKSKNKNGNGKATTNTTSNISPSAYGRKRKTQEITQEEIDMWNTVVDNAIKEGAIEPVKPEYKRLVLRMLAERRRDEIAACNYYEVETIDKIIAQVRAPPKSSNDLLYEKLDLLKKNLEDVCEYYDQIDIDKSRAINQLMIQQDNEYQTLLDVQNEEMEEFCETLPQFDDPRLIKFSGNYLAMRAKEKNYAEGGDYDGATRMHQEADNLEEKERHEAVRRIIRSCNLRRKKEEDRQKLQREVFVARWSQKIENEREKWDHKLRITQAHAETIQSRIDIIKRKLGLRITPMPLQSVTS